MKAKKILFGSLLLIAVGAIFAASIFGITALVSAAGVSLAVAGAGASVGTPVQDTVTMQNVDEANKGILDIEVVRKITQVRPNATPLDTLLNSISARKTTKAFEVQYFASGVRDKVTSVKTSVAATSGSNAPTAMITVELENGMFADTHDVIMFPEITDTSDGRELTAHVFKRDSGNSTISMMVINGKGANKRDIPAIPEGSKVVRIGKAMDERAARCEDFAIIPDDDSNYCQIFMSTLSEGFYQKMAKKRVDFDITELKDSALYDFRRQKEGAALFGKKAKLISPVTGLEHYHMDGIATIIGRHKTINFNASEKVSDAVVDWAKAIFRGNNGSDVRYAFAGDDIISWMSKGADVQKFMDANAVEMKHGIRFNKIETNFGTLLIKSHPDFEAYGYSNKMLVFDPEYIDLYHRLPMGTRIIDNEKNGTERSTSYVMEEAFCPIVTNPDVHALISMN
ncbi:MAG: hypothetical protein NC324_08620 [Bacteroides sp.]|nr:hypothetical protein [Bacteroides sp.]